MSSTYEGLRYKVCMNLLPFAIVLYYFFLLILIGLMPLRILVYIYIYIGFKTFFYVVRHLDPIASCLPTDLHLGFFRSWSFLHHPSSFSSVFLVLSFVSVSTSMLFWVIFLLPFSEHSRTM